MTALAHSPCTQYRLPVPVETGRIRRRPPSFHNNSTWRLRSISTRVAPPLASMGAGGRALVTLETTSGVARLLRTMPVTFWKASTAWPVVASNTPSTLPVS